jgi:hypothetical protein
VWATTCQHDPVRVLWVPARDLGHHWSSGLIVMWIDPEGNFARGQARETNSA